MSLKQIINRNKAIQSGAIDARLILQGEPMIYSIKYSVGMRRRGLNYFRNEQWRGLLKCYFNAYRRSKVPLVLIIRFYVSPPTGVKLSKSDLRKEKIPAVHCHELCEYLLSFMEMLLHVLINSYRQFVRIEMDKFYSDTPRTVFQFMKWEHYEHLKDNNTLDTQSKSLSTRR
jgi:hypothetical protein